MRYHTIRFAVIPLLAMTAGCKEGQPLVTEAEKSRMRTLLGSALQRYKADVGIYPEELRHLVDRPDDPDRARTWAGPYLQSLEWLKDPWGGELQFRFPSGIKAQGYDLWSNGPDGQSGTVDDFILD